MGVVGSLPLTKTIDTQNEHSLSSPNEAISVIPDVINNNHTKTFRHQKPYETISHDHLCVKNYQSIALRLQTRRCLKHRRRENKEVIKRQLQCKKNRQTTRKLNSKYDTIREQLNKQIQKLELKQNDLLSKVDKLYLYKHQLEIIYQQVNSNHKLIG